MNLIIVSGRVGKDPTSRAAGQGTVAGFSVATDSYRKVGEKWETTTTWHDVIAWNKLADKVIDKVFKGATVMVKGSLSKREYTNSEGVKKMAIEIIADTVECYDKKPTPPPSHDHSGDRPAAFEGDGSSYDDLPF